MAGVLRHSGGRNPDRWSDPSPLWTPAFAGVTERERGAEGELMAQPNPTGVIGIGVDLIEIDRVRDVLTRHPGRFPARCFTEAEAAYCRRGAHPEERFAARFAAKEAVMKALGTGWNHGVNFRDIEVTRQPSGAPGIRLAGAALEVANRLGVERIALSLSHGRDQAIAFVIFSGTVPA